MGGNTIAYSMGRADIDMMANGLTPDRLRAGLGALRVQAGSNRAYKDALERLLPVVKDPTVKQIVIDAANKVVFATGTVNREYV